MSTPPVPTEEISEFCRRWRITQLSVMGSILRADQTPASDVDVVVQFAPNSDWSLLDVVQMRDELAAVFGRTVDIIEESAVRNPYMRESIRRTKRVLYAA